MAQSDERHPNRTVLHVGVVS